MMCVVVVESCGMAKVAWLSVVDSESCRVEEVVWDLWGFVL